MSQIATISLMTGPTSNLQKVEDIASKSLCASPISTIRCRDHPSAQLHTLISTALLTVMLATSTSPYSWTPSTSLAQDAYALSITQSGHTNYSPQFTIKGVTPGVIVVTATAPRSAPSIQQAQLAPTPAYVANGGLSGNGTYPYYATVSGTGIALPTGTSALGQYAVFEGAAAGRGCGVLRSLLAAMVLFVPFL